MSITNTGLLSDMDSESILHIVTWNVAGWRTTSEKIKYRHGSIENWIKGCNIDILCLQEIKIDQSEIEMKGKDFGAKICDFDTFWSYPKQISTNNSSQQGKGLNGVSTWARKGLTIKATKNVFKDSIYSNEGRCLVTDHDQFVLFNVYVPFSGSNYSRLQFKIKFLLALREKMCEYRTQGKHVILAGDLNVAPRPIDSCPNFRKIDMDMIMNKAVVPNNIDESSIKLLESIIQTLRETWPIISNCIRSTRTVEEEAAFNNSNSRRFRVSIQRSDGRKIKLGRQESSEPKYDYTIDEVSIPHPYDDSHEQRLIIRRKDTLILEELKDCMKLANDNPSVQELREEHWEVLADYFSLPCHNPSSVQWIQDLLQKDKMVDSFAYFYPNKKYRFTCWDQQTNRRYSNEGTRIDHILVDESLIYQAGIIGLSKLAGEEEMEREKVELSTNEWDKRAALGACTGFGSFKGATYDGNGIPDAPAAAFSMHFRPKHTGIMYTPPEYSDHVGVSFCLDKRKLNIGNLSLSRDDETKLCQPHLKQSSITSFFGAKTSRPSTVNTAKESTDLIKDSNVDFKTAPSSLNEIKVQNNTNFFLPKQKKTKFD